MSVQVKDIYTDLIGSKVPHSSSIYPPLLWKTGCPSKSIFFSWFVFHRKNLTWENLRKRNWHGPSRCAMCDSHEESNYHMYFQCQSMMQIWRDLENLYGFPLIVFASTQATFDWWSGKRDSWRPMIIIVLQCTWKWRNRKNFNESKIPLKSILQHIISFYDSMPKKLPKIKNGNSKEKVCFRSEAPTAFFDGAE